MDADDIDKMWKSCQHKLPVKKNEIYPCPECGGMTLYAGEFGDYEKNYGVGKSKQKITCSMCDFVCPAKYSDNEWEAWDGFHKWLEKQGYLDAVEES